MWLVIFDILEFAIILKQFYDKNPWEKEDKRNVLKILQFPVEIGLTLSWLWSLSYWNQSIDLHSKSMDLILYDRDLRRERGYGVSEGFWLEITRSLETSRKRLKRKFWMTL